MAKKKRRKSVSGRKRKSPKRKSTKRKKGRRKAGGKIPLTVLKKRLTRLSAIVKKRGG